MARSIARQAAMQLLYERLSGGEADDESLDLVYEQLSMLNAGEGELRPSKSELAYINDVLAGVKEHENELDETIEKHSTGAWTLDRVPHVDLSILRLAAYEMFHRDDVPDNVAISEAMSMAGRYSEPKSSRYINGVLGAMERGKREPQNEEKPEEQ
ncbi:MAG: transcription antitermination factor NusB [Clostridia bacterium]|nr:transcription antitermination factor NusB [Clostridia bacterium]MDD6041673.1 transcription antitermination factor NusB [Clostridia bacterium]